MSDLIEELSSKLLVRIEKVENGEPFPGEVLSEINKHSWSGVAERINGVTSANC